MHAATHLAIDHSFATDQVSPPVPLPATYVPSVLSKIGFACGAASSDRPAWHLYAILVSPAGGLRYDPRRVEGLAYWVYAWSTQTYREEGIEDEGAGCEEAVGRLAFDGHVYIAVGMEWTIPSFPAILTLI